MKRCIVFDTSNVKIGKNLAVNRIKLVNGRVMYDWLNLSYESYKLKCKTIFSDPDMCQLDV